MPQERRVSVQRPRCPFCHDAIPPGEKPEVCAHCHALHHGECWREHGGCSGCGVERLPAQALAGPPVEVRCVIPGCGRRLRRDVSWALCREHLGRRLRRFLAGLTATILVLSFPALRHEVRSGWGALGLSAALVTLAWIAGVLLARFALEPDPGEGREEV